MTDIKKSSVIEFMNQFKQSLLNVFISNNKDKFVQETKSLFPQQFMSNISTILQPISKQFQQQNMSLGNKLLQINQLCLYHLAQKVNDLLSNQQTNSVSQSVKTKPNKIQQRDYQVLQQAVQKAEQQIRKHIGIQHQMKICLEQVEDQLNDLTNKNQDLKKQNSFLKKELSIAKKKQIQTIKKLAEASQKIQICQQRMRATKANSKLNTEPQSSINHDTSRKSLKKSFQSSKQKSIKKPVFSKGIGYSKLGSRKASKSGLIENQIDINLHNFITLSTQIKKQQQINKTEGKQVFWNKRLKKKQYSTGQGNYLEYATLENHQNRSLNISPRQIRKQQKQKELKNVYTNKTRQLIKSYQPTIYQDTATRKKQRRDYSNADAYQIKRNFLGNGQNPDRSKSVVN